MKLDISSCGQTTVVRVAEQRLDATAASRFKDRLREVIGRGAERVVVDLADVDFMDSSGLGAIIAVRKSLPDGRELVLARLAPNVERVFRLTRMDQVFTILPAGEFCWGDDLPDSALQPTHVQGQDA